MLDSTIDWYRALRLQPSADEPSDILIQYENRQTADAIVRLTFASARANADRLSKQAVASPNDDTSASGATAQTQRRGSLYAQQQAVKAELAADERALPATGHYQAVGLNAKIAELNSELDLINTRIEFLNTVSGSGGSGDASELSGNALTAQIDAMAVALPSVGATSNASPASASTASSSAIPAPSANTADRGIAARSGIWDLSATVLRLSENASLLNALDRRTVTLQHTLAQIRSPLINQLRALAARGDALGAQADSSSAPALTGIRDQLDDTATQFKQISTLLVPLGQVDVLLNQYRGNLHTWHDAVNTQILQALKSLAIRLCALVFILAVMFSIAELWRRAVVKYVPDFHRQRQLLLLRRIILWSVVAATIGFAFASELGSVLTFAGLITAGVAVAMQSVLVSIVGYFFLVGKYGIRVGDRVQIGGVTGDVLAVGLVRLYLMELAGQNMLVHTGRVVAFANSIVFQVSSGLFKQLPGVDFSWHEITVTLPPGIDYAAIKRQLSQAITDVLKEYRDELERQTQELHRTAAARFTTEATPQVQLRFSATGADALVRYPVRMRNAAEVDERISEELYKVIASFPGRVNSVNGAAGAGAPLPLR